MNNFSIEGKLHELYDEQQVTEKFRKREFVLEIADGSYLQFPKFQVTQDRCAILNNFQKGDKVVAHFNLKGRPYTRPSDGTTTYFTNLEVWKVEAAEEQLPPAPPPHSVDDMPMNFPEAPNSNGSGAAVPDDDLPF